MAGNTGPISHFETEAALIHFAWPVARGFRILYCQDIDRSNRKRVFILGAGCSAQYGYPLNVKLSEELNSFGSKIPDRCPVIQNAVSKSIELAARFPRADTLDRLVNLSEEHFKDFRRDEGGHNVTDAHNELRKLTDEQILNAKLATTALFLAKESDARKKTLTGYREYLLPSIFGQGRSWQSALNHSDCCVLTFNYDRLFEIAFLDHFKDAQGCFAVAQFPLYGRSALNSGIDPTLGWESKAINIESNRFCFLKLHGSAGWWAKKCATPPNEKFRDYCAESPQVPTDLFQLEQFLAANKQFYPWEPLITFPHEKQLFTAGLPVDFEQSAYIEKIWRHAAVLLAETTEVTVIGYSFAELDRDHVVDNLLRKTPKTTRIRIENKDVEAVRHALETYPDLQGRLEFITRTFRRIPRATPAINFNAKSRRREEALQFSLRHPPSSALLGFRPTRRRNRWC